jgi:DNA-binding LytR/AlgR family response regulator
MRIAVCEDQAIHREHFIHSIQEWAEANDEAVVVHGYANAEVFLFHRAADGPFDCLFIDIDLGDGVNGVSLAQKIRETDEKIILVFVTAFIDHVFVGYKVRALDYLVKPVNKSDFEYILRRVCDSAKDNLNDVFLIKTTDEKRRVPYDEILFVESHLHYLDIQTTGGVLRIRDTLSNIERQLPTDKFIRAHRSFIANLSHIKTANRSFVTFYNGEQIPTGRKFWKEIDTRMLSSFGRRPDSP